MKSGPNNCQYCQCAIEQTQGAGRPRKYCNPTCRQMATIHRGRSNAALPFVEAIAAFKIPDRADTGEDCPFCHRRDSRYRYETPHTDDCIYLQALELVST